MVKISTLVQIPKSADFCYCDIQCYSKLNFSKIQDDYLEGAISISYFGKELMGTHYHDCIIPLWIYLLNGLEEYHAHGIAEIWFPDTAVSITINDLKNDFLLFKIDGEGVRLPASEFLQTLLQEAKRFFEVLERKREAEQANTLLKLFQLS